jgi:hypothetical protein
MDSYSHQKKSVAYFSSTWQMDMNFTRAQIGFEPRVSESPYHDNFHIPLGSQVQVLILPP